MSRWRPISSAPWGEVLVCYWVGSDGSGPVLRVGYKDDDGSWVVEDEYLPRDYPITHWQPLPAPPTTKPRKVTRSAKSGRFASKQSGKQNPDSHVTEKV